MPCLQDLPYLLQLLDDEDVALRRVVLEHILSFASTFKKHLVDCPVVLTPRQELQLLEVWREYQGDWLRRDWTLWKTPVRRKKNCNRPFRPCRPGKKIWDRNLVSAYERRGEPDAVALLTNLFKIVDF